MARKKEVEGWRSVRVDVGTFQDLERIKRRSGISLAGVVAKCVRESKMMGLELRMVRAEFGLVAVNILEDFLLLLENRFGGSFEAFVSRAVESYWSGREVGGVSVPPFVDSGENENVT